MDEMILIDKPAGMTSFGVVARVRRVLSAQAGHKVKVGHTGTLDPFATGLLILMTGKYTKKCQEFLKLDKEYVATLRLGATSTTGDPEGEINDFAKPDGARQRESECRPPVATGRPDTSRKTFISPSKSQVAEAVSSFIGEIEQVPPAFSAIKVKGRRAYDLAREGKEVKLEPRKVKIYELEILEYKWPELKLRCKVSSGTYIRSLAQDIGEALGVGAYLTALRRTKIANYDVKDAKKLEELGIVD